MQEPFHFSAPARLVDFMRQADRPGLINLAAGVPGFDALPLDALREATNEAFATDGAALFAYHHPEGDHELRALLAENLVLRGVADARADRLILTSGCSQALHGMLSILVRPGDTVACEAPAYYGLLELIAAAGARVLPIPQAGLHGPHSAGIDLDAAAELLPRWKPKCLVVCTSLSNPSGATLSESGRIRLVEICRSAGVRLIEDDIYSELLDAGAPKPCRAFDDGSTVSFVTSFSKTVSPGLRVGYCIPGTPELHDAFAAHKTQQDIHSGVLTEAVLRRFIARGALAPHLAWLRERNLRRRTLALDTIRRAFPAAAGMEAPAGGYMLWVELPKGIEVCDIRERAQKAGVVFAAGNVFFADGSGGGFVRLNCAKVSEAELVRGLELLGGIVGEIVRS